jgi:hypothetical protein
VNVRTGNYNGAVIVIPTRNRAQLAMNSVRSLLDQPVDDLNILVSDNSTSERDRNDLESFCASLDDSRVSYVKPPQPVPMPEHWEWAIQNALANYDERHFSYLTDRMMFRKGGLKEVLGLAALYPDKVITYNHDRISDDLRPVRVQEYEVTEKLLEVESQRLLQLVAEVILHHGLPRMMNCVVPRRVFQGILQRFGNVFTSIAPDFNFCYRCLDMEDSILFYDASPLFHYAQDRSNGASAVRGDSTPDTLDFEANLPVDSLNRNYATPIPSLITATNAVLNEYLIHKQETQSPRFLELNLQNYLRANAIEVAEIREPQLRAQAHALLVQHGYRDPGEESRRFGWLRSGGLSSVIDTLKRVTQKGAGPRASEFADLDEAIHYLRYVSRGNLTSWTFGAEVLHGRELPGRGQVGHNA